MIALPSSGADFVAQVEYVEGGRVLEIASTTGDVFARTGPTLERNQQGTRTSRGTRVETSTGVWSIPRSTGAEPTGAARLLRGFGLPVGRKSSMYPRAVLASHNRPVATIDRSGKHDRAIMIGSQTYELTVHPQTGRWSVDGLLSATRSMGSRLTAGTGTKPFTGAFTSTLAGQPDGDLLLALACQTIVLQIDAKSAGERRSMDYARSSGL
jgi:hypothetical protein